MRGAPSKYNPEICDKICDAISTSSKSLRTICKELEITTMTVLRWLSDPEKKEFCLQYARAKQEQADFMVEEIIDIADNCAHDTIIVKTKNGIEHEQENKEWVNRSRLRIESRKWIASKLKPKKYGDKLDVTSDGEKLNPIIVKFIEDGDNDSSAKVDELSKDNT